MNDTDELLQSLSLEQLITLQEKMIDILETQERDLKRLTSAPPVTDKDVSALAKLQGLDISSLVREIAKR